jgi:3,4-dihydroxy 2-butanone 4-phosphate synthase/GTP cyclohydrolase II
VSSEVAAPEADAPAGGLAVAGVPAADVGMDAGFGTIERALADLAAGRPVVVVDDADRENEGDLIFAAEKATPELVSFMVRYTSGYICVGLTEADCDRLDLPPMHHTNLDSFRTAFTVTVDAKVGISTGISAADRARTIALLADPTAVAGDLVRPGHVLPLRAREGGVLRRPGHTEAAVDLARLAGLAPVGALCEIVSQKEEGDMARGDELRVFAEDHQLTLISIAQLIAYRRHHEKHVVRVAQARIPTPHGEFVAYGYDSLLDGIEHIALVRGDVAELNGAADDGEDVLVRVHSECLTGDVFGSLRCDCGPQLDAALAAVAAEGCSTCAGTRAAASACSTSCRPTSSRRREPTPSTRTSRSACPPTRATTASARRSSATSGCGRCGCSPTTPTSGPGSRAGGCGCWAGCGCRCGPCRRTCAT